MAKTSLPSDVRISFTQLTKHSINAIARFSTGGSRDLIHSNLRSFLSLISFRDQSTDPYKPKVDLALLINRKNKETRTPAMVAGLSSRALSFRDIFVPASINS
jgi:hypothetical protein